MHRGIPSPEPLVYSFIYSFNHVYLLESPKRSTSTYGEKTDSPSKEPHADGRPTKKWVRPGSLRGSLSTLLSLPRCHAALSTIHPTLTWIDQSPVSRSVPYNTHHGIPSTIVTASHVTHGRIEQSFSTAGQRQVTGTCLQLYRATSGSVRICHFISVSKFYE